LEGMDVFLGMDWMTQHKVVLDRQNRRYRLWTLGEGSFSSLDFQIGQFSP
jgi:hypothetical protein